MYLFKFMFVQAVSNSRRIYILTCMPLSVGTTSRHLHSRFPKISGKAAEA